MEEQKLTVQKKGVVLCPNCGTTEMEKIRNPFTTMDRLEWHSFLTTGLICSILFLLLGQRVASLFGVTCDAPGIFQYSLAGVLILCAFAASYFWIAGLSFERYRHDVICVWDVRCARCHARYRVVRPYGTIPPWEEEENAEDAQMDEEIPEELPGE